MNYTILSLFCICFFTQKKYRADLKAAEKKVLLILVTFTVSGMYNLVGEVSVIVEKNPLYYAVTNYFACEASGHVPGQCSREEFDKLAIPYLSGISYFIFVAIPLTMLIFVINWKSVLVKCKKESLEIGSTYHTSKITDVEQS